MTANEGNWGGTVCGSSLDAAMMGSRTVESGDADVVLAGGVESMSRAPWVLPKPSRAFRVGDIAAVSTTLGWRLVNPKMPAEWTISLGECNELLEFAVRSHVSADAAWNAGCYDNLVVRVPGVDLCRDEAIRPEPTIEKLSGLTPSVTRARSTTVRRRCYWDQPQRRSGSGRRRWRGSLAVAHMPSIRKTSDSPPGIELRRDETRLPPLGS